MCLFKKIVAIAKKNSACLSNVISFRQNLGKKQPLLRRKERS